MIYFTAIAIKKIRIFRICKYKRAKHLSGFRAGLKGTRWNRRGTSLLYTASHRSLVFVEILVHLGNCFPEEDYAIVTLEIPDENITFFDSNLLPVLWYKIFEPAGQAEFTDQWLIEEQSVAFSVPSAVIIQETNYLINPLHPDFQEIKIRNIEKFNFDDRFFKDVIE